MVNKKNVFNSVINSPKIGIHTRIVVGGIAIATLFGINKLSESLVRNEVNQRGYQITEISRCPACIFTNPELLMLGQSSFSYKFTAKDSLGNETHGVGGSNLFVTKVSIDQHK